MTGQFYNLAAPITKSDSANYPQVDRFGPAQAIYIGTVTGATGAIVVIQPNNVAVTFTGVTAGTILPVQSIRVNSGTTDTSDMIALWQI